jgi:hypothetical protein
LSWGDCWKKRENADFVWILIALPQICMCRCDVDTSLSKYGVESCF